MILDDILFLKYFDIQNSLHLPDRYLITLSNNLDALLRYDLYAYKPNKQKHLLLLMEDLRAQLEAAKEAGAPRVMIVTDSVKLTFLLSNLALLYLLFLSDFLQAYCKHETIP